VPDYLPWPLGRTSPELLPRVNIKGLKPRPAGAEGPKTLLDECAPLMEYGHNKLALLLHSQRLNVLHSFSTRGLVSHVVNPGAMDTEFGRSESRPQGRSSMRMNMMQYFPPVWIAKKIYQSTFGQLATGTLRSATFGAKAVFHVATAPALGSGDGGGVFADTAGAFVDCGKTAALCGRVEVGTLPAAVTDQELAATLWRETEGALGRQHLSPFKDPKAKKKK